MTKGRGFPDEGADGNTEGVHSSHAFARPSHSEPTADTVRRDDADEPDERVDTLPSVSQGVDTTTSPNVCALNPGGVLGPIEPGQILFNQYRVVRPIGKGGMGEVWLVEHLDFECLRALKLIGPAIAADPQIRRRFRLEAKAGARLNHSNAVTVHHMKLTEDAAFIEMEYVEGQSMNRLLKAGEPMPLNWTARILAQLCDVLQVAHDHNIVHRDLKPANLMLLDGRPPDREHLKVLDFGIAKILDPGGLNNDEQLTQPGSFLGTVLYTSPEQATLGPVDARTDLYSVGVILYELLTGHRPFSGPAAMHGHVFQPPPPFNQLNPNVQVPPRVEAVVLRCLAKRPEDRPQTAGALAREFLDAVSATPRVVKKGFAGDAMPQVGTDTALAVPSRDYEFLNLTTQPMMSSEVSAPTLTDLPRRLQSTYEILERIFEGGGATYYRANDAARARVVAIKEFHDRFRGDPGQDERFWEELQSLLSLRHEHLVPLYEVDRERGWIVMELMQASLEPKGVGGALKPAVVRGILRQGLEALRFLHERGKIHGAVKPGNLLIDARGRVKLGDATGTTPDSLIHAPIGTPKYLAPERLNPQFGPIGPAIDLYGLGFAAVELLLGPAFARLFPGIAADGGDPSRAWLRWQSAPGEHLAPIRQIDSSIPEDLARVIDRLAKKNVAERYPDAASALGDLVDRPILPIDLTDSSFLILAEPEDQPPPPAPPGEPSAQASAATIPTRVGSGRNASKVLVALAVLLVVIPVAIYSWQPGNGGSKEIVSSPPRVQASPPPTEVRADPAVEVKKGEETPLTVTGTDPEKVKEGAMTVAPAEKQEVATLAPTTTIPPVEPVIVVEPPKVALPPELTLKGADLGLVLIPEGVFLMGSPEGDGDPNEHPRHEVRISRPFYMGRTEVTQAQFERVMGSNPSYFSKSGKGAKRVADLNTENHPVEQVSYAEALEFCRRLARLENLREGSVRLPTESEWEYASWANSTVAPDTDDALQSIAWYQANAKEPHPVAKKKANAFRLYDMAGNVSEWCSDWYQEPYPEVATIDPTGPEKPDEEAKRVVRGGSWFGKASTCRPTDRDAAAPDEPVRHIGFRIVVESEAVKRLLSSAR